MCCAVLKKLGVTHVLNAACGKDKSLSLINTSQSFYRDSGIKFLGVEAYDITGFHMYPYFEEASEFIHDAIQRQGEERPPVAKVLKVLKVLSNVLIVPILLKIRRQGVRALSTRYLPIGHTRAGLSDYEARADCSGGSSRGSKSP